MIFLSVATGRSQRTTVLPAFCDSCVCSLSVVGTDENWNFSAVRSPIGLKLGGDLGLVSQINVHVLVSRFVCFCEPTHSVWLTMILIGFVVCLLFGVAFLQINSNFLHFLDSRFQIWLTPPAPQWRNFPGIGVNLGPSARPGSNKIRRIGLEYANEIFSNFQVNSILEISLGIYVLV
jgi:hypothetical protein